MRILIDLDIITVALWEKEDERRVIANNFLKRVIDKEFYVMMPFFLIELVLEWRNEALKEEIKEFYISNSSKFISDAEFKGNCKKKNIDAEAVIKSLELHDIKREDSVLVLMASLFELDYLVTYNRKHLKNNGKLINKILKENGLKAIKIVEPEEL